MGLDIHLRKNKVVTSFDENNYINNWIGGYGLNITHNCNVCALHVKLTTPECINNNIYISNKLTLYDVLWHGDEHNIVQAKDIIPYVKEGLYELINHVIYYQQFDPPNGYGDVFSLIRFCIILLAKCQKYPKSYLEFSC